MKTKRNEEKTNILETDEGDNKRFLLISIMNTQHPSKCKKEI